MKNFPQLLTTGALAIAGTAAALTLSSVAQAATITQVAGYPALTGTTPTNFANQPVNPNISLFDPSLGTLQSVKITLDGRVAGTAQLESLDASPATVTYNLQAQVGFSVTGPGTLVQTIPVATGSFSATAFDSAIDFGGTSGTTLNNLSGNSQSMTTLTGINVNPFIGSGNLPAFLTGTGSSVATGAGNLIAGFSTQAGGTVTVEYNYTPSITTPTPEPTTLLGLGSVAALGLFGRKKKSNND